MDGQNNTESSELTDDETAQSKGRSVRFESDDNMEPTDKKSSGKGRVSFAGDDPEDPEADSEHGNGGRKDSIEPLSIPATTTRPDWFQELTEEQIAMFRQVFELLDRDGGGSLDAEELYTLMKDLDIDVTLDEIRTVLKDLDKDGNGEIDFDEFLYAMSETEGYLDLISQGMDPEEARKYADRSYSKRQTLFFTAITNFAIKNSLGEIERYYASKMRTAPHVISCYTAGARLIGLNDRQLEQQLRKMQKAAKNQKSPYAKPLPFVTVPTKQKKPARKPGKHKPKQKPPPPKSEPEKPAIKPPQERSDSEDEEDIQRDSFTASGERRRTAILPDAINMQLVKTLHTLAERGNVIAKIPDIQLVPQFRNKLASTVDLNEPICSSIRKRRRTFEHKTPSPKGKPGDNGLSKQHGWLMPRLECGQAPLPLIKVNQKGKPFTIEDVADIRKRVSSALDGYYSTLAQNHVKTAWDHWDQLHTEEIRSDRLREQFRRTYKAYSPHKEQNVFTICPWIPGPRYKSRQPTLSGRAALSRRPASQPLDINYRPSSRLSDRSSCASPVPRSQSRPNFQKAPNVSQFVF